MVRTGIQLYTLRHTDLTLSEQIEAVNDIGFDAVEFAGIPDNKVAATAATREQTGVDASMAHVAKDDLDTAFDDTTEPYQNLGCDHLVIPYIDGERYESTADIDELVDELAVLADRVEDRGMTLGYHNHAHEFRSLPGHESAFHYFVDELDDSMMIELDVGWTTAAGYDPVSLIDRWDDKIYAVHITDVAAQQLDTAPKRVGDGIVDISGCIQATDDAGIDRQFYEHEALDDPLDALPEEYRKLASYTDA